MSKAEMTEPLAQQVLEYRLLYAILVAGKSARFAESVMANMLSVLHDKGCLEFALEDGKPPEVKWFASIQKALDKKILHEVLLEARTGNYGKTRRAFGEVVKRGFDLATVTAEQLETLHGVGPKTSRFFLRWTGRRERVAVLDVHILRWLRSEGYQVPEATPQSIAQYKAVENVFLAVADRLGKHPADLDRELSLRLNKSGIRS